MHHRFRESFFNETRAEAFAEYLKTQGAEDIEIWGGRDAFGQDQYTVCWNLWNSDEDED